MGGTAYAAPSIARFPDRLAELLFVAGGRSHAPHRTLPDSPKNARSKASNCGFQDDGFCRSGFSPTIGSRQPSQAQPTMSG